MGLFGLGKKDPAAEGDRWYEKSLRSGDRELEFLRKSVSLGSKKGMMGLARFYLKRQILYRSKLPLLKAESVKPLLILIKIDG